MKPSVCNLLAFLLCSLLCLLDGCGRSPSPVSKPKETSGPTPQPPRPSPTEAVAHTDSDSAPFGQRPGLDQIIIDEDTLKGITSMSVMVEVNGIRDLSESTYISDMESRLKAAGITVLQPTDKPKTYPLLWLSVEGDFIRAGNGTLSGASIVTYRLVFYQLIPRKVGSQTFYIRGSTLALYGTVWGNSIGIAANLRNAYTGAIDEFVEGYKKVNPSHR